MNEYEKFQKLGIRENAPLPSLEQYFEENKIMTAGRLSLGLVEIPLEQVAGTYTASRGESFSRSFYPLLDKKSEFAAKWEALYQAHMTEGIREPVRAYEYMNRFYIEEGNKRVSVLKCAGAFSIAGEVTRIMPVRSEEKANRLYFEFVDFYRLSELNSVFFSQEGSYAALQKALGKRPNEAWSEADRRDFNFLYRRFCTAYQNAAKAVARGQTPGDAFLCFLKLYDYGKLLQCSVEELKERVIKSMEELALPLETEPEMQMEPSGKAEKKKALLLRLLSPNERPLKIAFIHEKTPQTSEWAYAHDMGRKYLENAFGQQIETACYPGADKDTAYTLVEQAVNDGNTMIFTTSPPLLQGSLKAAAEFSDVHILNCSLGASHKLLRTYYARMYEAKFLMGVIAGAMAENDKIGYMADYPIYGMTANINAFALGAKMVNPRVKIYLEWSTVKGRDPFQAFRREDITYISGQDMALPGQASRYYGLYWLGKHYDYPVNLAMPIWHWGKFYEKMIRNIFNGTYDADTAQDSSKGLNYWWGMSSDVIEVVCSRHLPIGTARLVGLLKKTIRAGEFNPFEGTLYSQEGIVRAHDEKLLRPEEIARMDWLAENVVGQIPAMRELVEKAKPVVSEQGLAKAVEA